MGILVVVAVVVLFLFPLPLFIVDHVFFCFVLFVFFLLESPVLF